MEGWVTEAEDDEEMTGFLPDDFLDFEHLPEGDTVDLYAAWYVTGESATLSELNLTLPPSSLPYG